MAKVAIYALAAVVLCQSVCVFSRQVNLDDYDFDQFINGNNNNNNNNVQPTQAPSGITTTSTTTASPQFTACLNNCPATPQYNPVCGTNQVNYPNVYRLRCAQNCGLNVDVMHVGTCGRSPGGK